MEFKRLIKAAIVRQVRIDSASGELTFRDLRNKTDLTDEILKPLVHSLVNEKRLKMRRFMSLELISPIPPPKSWFEV